ncbi:MAG: hypothetical protein ACOCVZ_04965, partial [Gemmatimonadota bacterium]
EAVRGGERSAWVDGGGVVVGSYWERLSGDRAGREVMPLLFRPGREHAALVAEELVRSGGFALVVLTGSGAGRLGDGEGVRLGSGAREGGSALVVVAEGAPVSHLRARSWLDPSGFLWRRGPWEPVSLEAVAMRVRVRAMGMDRKVRFRLPVEHHDVRMSLEPGLVDRRGVRR